MERNRWRRTIGAVIIVTALGCAPSAAAAPTSPLCDGDSYRKAHPLICDTGGGGPFSITPGRGGDDGAGGGLIGRIRRALGI